MNRRIAAPAAVLLALVLSAGLGAAHSGFQRVAAPAVTIPFELATGHIIVRATINKSRPLSFVLDTGANVAIVRIDTAKELGLKLEGNLSVGGAGSGVQTGYFVRNASWNLVGLRSDPQPVVMAIPLTELPAGMGRHVDGIIGGEFIRRFVIEIDYQARSLKLHDPGEFRYTGSGETLPLELDANNHPEITAKVTPLDGKPIERKFLFDIGSGGALVLHSPFVREHALLDNLTTIPVIGAAGAGGKVAGFVGRVSRLQIGRFTMERPITMFSQDRAGAFANAARAGNIGARIAMRFRVFLDYGRRQMILEPTPTLGDPFDRAFSGMAIRTGPPDYRTFKIAELLPQGPAKDAGIQVGDVITSVDGVPADKLTLTTLNEMFEKTNTYEIVLRRGEQLVTVKLTPKRLI
jgi:hypothetical protein